MVALRGGWVIHQTKLKHKRGLRAGWRVGKTLPKAKIMNSGKGTARLEQARAGSTGERERGSRGGGGGATVTQRMYQKRRRRRRSRADCCFHFVVAQFSPLAARQSLMTSQKPLPLPIFPSRLPSPFGHARQHDAGVESAWHTIVSTLLRFPPPSTLPVRALTCKQGRRRKRGREVRLCPGHQIVFVVATTAEFMVTHSLSRSASLRGSVFILTSFLHAI